MSVLGPLIADKRVLICVGSGGVGKTTIAAALGLQAAAEGRKVVVCTIDPARRLANSLGLTELGNVETRVPPDKLAAAGVVAKGELFAMMLDLKRSWDDFILRHAPPERRDAILGSRFYQQLSSALVGSQEYVAMEKLVELAESRDYDLLVLDTPPTANALDFLDAPNRVLDFFGDEKVRWMLAPALKAGRVGLKMFNLTGGYFVKTLSRFTGMEVLQELSEFLLCLAPMYDVFKERAAQVKEMLASPRSAFVLVTSPSTLTVDEAIYFHTLLRQNGMPIASVVANRVHQALGGAGELSPAQLDALAELLAGAGGSSSASPRERLARALHDAQLLAELDQAEVRRLAQACAPTPLISVPRFDTDVHDVAGLRDLNRHLFA
ncbi:MAG: ArsA family ATPase [Deltaproteobacteria bacterium]|nr:ArsA family ATPase [Deltaproteobacteria bacterium]